MIEDKMVRSGFLGHKILTYGLKAFFVFSKKKIVKIQSCPCGEICMC
jgi:hypothetical protein